MATICVTTSLDLCDYFSKYGFGDGDDGAALELGFAVRLDAVRLLNEELERGGLDLRAHAEDAGTIHKPCQIVLRHRLGEDVHVEVDSGDVVGLEVALAEHEGAVDEAWSEAYDRFEELLLARSPVMSVLRRCALLARQIVDGDPTAIVEARPVADEAEKVLM